MRKTIPLLLLSLAALAPTATAQWTRVTGSGCAGVNHLIGVRGTPNLGQTVGVAVRCSSAADAPFMMAGAPIRQFVAIRSPIACVRLCNLALLPVLISAGRPGNSASITVPIPRNRALVGAVLRFQGLCLSQRARCVTLSAAVQMTVQP